MTSFSFKPAISFSLSELADLFTRSFEGYFVPINLDEITLHTMLRRGGVDLSESRVFLNEGQPIGLAMIARRGWTSRLAAMGIVTESRHSGVGTWAMQNLMQEARARGDREMVLEVIEQNTAGIKLYQKVGFKTVRRLVGFKLEHPQVEPGAELEEIDIRELAHLVTLHGGKDWPWQLSGESIALVTPPARAYRLNDACCFISSPEAEHVAISSVLEKTGLDGAGTGPDLIRAVFSRFPNKVWHASAIFPEEMSPIFEKAGMVRETLSQLQMSAKL